MARERLDAVLRRDHLGEDRDGDLLRIAGTNIDADRCVNLRKLLVGDANLVGTASLPSEETTP